ncbi:MAG: 50S ribosomal protein L15 [Candidatus Pacearchaeota archaeon]|nr:50S ribosomal protein L15 [Candidatus Pacearchaeota archaeon]MDE1848631.1 uL15 family ribosomal protein [Nanoarchaeota archaeon]
MIKTHRKRKTGKYRGKRAGTYGWGARKKHKKSGHRGGKGMAGSGKRADQKKTLLLKLYGNNYFGKQGITSRKTMKDKSDRINLRDIEMNLESYINKGIAKRTQKEIEINLKSYKILGSGQVKNKFLINAKSASQSAIEKVKKAGGEIIVANNPENQQ